MSARAFQLASNGAEAELRAMLSSGEVQASACTTTGMYAGDSLLHIAARKGHTGVATLLIQAGAAVHARNAKGKTAAELAAEKGLGAMTMLLQQAAAAGPQHSTVPFSAAAPPSAPFAGAAQPSAPFAGAARPSVPFAGAAPPSAPFVPPSAPFAGAAQPSAPFAGAARPSPFAGAAPPSAPFAGAARPSAPFGAGFPTHAQVESIPSDMEASGYAAQSAYCQPPHAAYSAPQPSHSFQPPPAAPQYQPTAPPQQPPPQQPPPQPPPPQQPPPQQPPPQPASQPPLPPAQPSPQPATQPSPDATAAVQSVLREHLSDVGGSTYVAVVPSARLPNLLGNENARIGELCASTGSRVEIGEAAGSLAWVRITAGHAAGAEAMLWATLSVAADDDACGAAVAVDSDAGKALTPSTLEAARAASGTASPAAIAHTSGVLLVAAGTAAVHTALLLLLRDALRTEAAAATEAFTFTAYPSAVSALDAALAATPAAMRQAIRLLLPAARSSTTSGPPWRVTLWTTRAHLESAASLVATALEPHQSVFAQRAQLPPAVLGAAAASLPPSPPLPAALGGAAGPTAAGPMGEPTHELCASLLPPLLSDQGASPLLKLAQLRSALTALGPLSPQQAHRLRAACFAAIRARACPLRPTDISAPSAWHEHLAWLDAAVNIIDEQAAQPPGAPSDTGAGRLNAHANGAAGSSGAAAGGSGPMLSFGAALPAPLPAQSAATGAPPGAACGSDGGHAAAADAGDAGAADESSGSSSDESDDDPSEDERRRKRKEKKRKREKKEKKEKEKKEKRKKRRSDGGGGEPD